MAICHLLPVRVTNNPVARKDLVEMNMLTASKAPATWAVLRPTINLVVDALRANSTPISVANAHHNNSAKAPAAHRCTARKVLAVVSTASVALAAANMALAVPITAKVLP
jgi:hypothetical protein